MAKLIGICINALCITVLAIASAVYAWCGEYSHASYLILVALLMRPTD